MCWMIDTRELREQRRICNLCDVGIAQVRHPAAIYRVTSNDRPKRTGLYPHRVGVSVASVVVTDMNDAWSNVKIISRYPTDEIVFPVKATQVRAVVHHSTVQLNPGPSVRRCATRILAALSFASPVTH